MFYKKLIKIIFFIKKKVLLQLKNAVKHFCKNTEASAEIRFFTFRVHKSKFMLLLLQTFSALQLFIRNPLVRVGFFIQDKKEKQNNFWGER